MAAWDLTPAELDAYIDIHARRMEDQCYYGYNLAQTMAVMALGRDKPEPWQCFPGWIRRQEMSDDDIFASCLAWCGGTECKQED